MKNQNTYEKIYGYIDHCIDDALRSTDGAEVRPRFWFEVIGADMIFHINHKITSTDKKSDATVIKKVLWRLSNGVKKHFELNFFAPFYASMYDEFLSDMYSFAPLEDFSYSHALAMMKVLDDTYILCGKFYNRPEGEDAMIIVKEGSLEMFSKPKWDQFYLAYVKAYGDDPLTVWIAMRNGEDVSKPECIETKAKEDLKIHGCMYYSVCTKARKGCTIPTNGCYREKPIPVKDGLVLSRYRQFKQELLMSKKG